MVRINGIGTLIVLLTGAGLSWGQPATQPAPAGQPAVFPESTRTPTVLPAVSPSATPTPPERIITVEEPGQPPRKCKVLKKWHTPDGSLACEVQVIETGEIMTILDGAPVPMPQQHMASGSRFQETASRIFHWGYNSNPPSGAPLPPGSDGPMIAQPSPSRNAPAIATALPVVPSTVGGAAPPTDWRQSWGKADDHKTTTTPSYSLSTPPAPALPRTDYPSTPRTDYSVNVPARPAAPPLSYPTRADLPPSSYQAQATTRPESLFTPFRAPVKEEESVAISTAKAAIVAAASVPPKQTVTATVTPAPVKPAVTATVTAAPKAAPLPVSDNQKADPLAAPDRYSRKPLDLASSTLKGTDDKAKAVTPMAPKDQTVAAIAAKDPTAAPAKTLPPAAPAASGAKPLPAGAQSVLAAQDGSPGSICYLPVPIVTLPSGYRPQPDVARIPQPPRPIPPGPPSDPDTMIANAFTPAGPVNPGPQSPQQQMAMASSEMHNAFTTMPSQQAPQGSPAAMPQGMAAQGWNGQYYPRQMPPGMMAQGNHGQYYPGQMPQGMMAQGYNGQYYPGQMPQGQMPQGMMPQGAPMQMGAGMVPPGAYPPAMRPGYGPNPPTAMMPPPGAGGGVTPVAYYSAASAAQPSVMSSEMRPPAADGQNCQALVMLLRDALYPSQREWAAESLSALNWHANPQVLLSLSTAAREDPAPTVRVACVHCLAKMNASTPPVLAVLQTLKADTDPRVRQEAEQALSSLGRAQGRASVASN